MTTWRRARNDPALTPRARASGLLGLAGWLLVTFVAAALGAWASTDAATFYAQLAKPSWAPPAGVFGPVWSVLYCLMGISAWLAWRRTGFGKSAAFLYVLQLAANALWSWLFFAWHLGALATIGVVVLLALIVATARLFWRCSRVAALLLLPYLLWVTFASFLTWAVWQRNPGVL